MVECLIPTGEVVSFTARVSRSGGCFVPVHHLGLERCAVPVFEDYGVLVDLIQCRYDEVCGDDAELLIPADEGVTLTTRVSRSLCCCIPVHGLRLENRTVPILERYREGVDAVQRFDSKITRHYAEVLIPTGEGITLAERSHRSDSRCAVDNILRSTDHVIFPIHEGNGVMVDNEGTGDDYIVCRHRSRNLTPAAEGITYALCRSRFRRDSCAVFQSLRYAIGLAVHLIGQGVRVDGVLRMDGHVARHVGERCIPTGEGVTLAYRVSRSDSRLTLLNALCRDHGLIPIHEVNRVNRVLGITCRYNEIRSNDVECLIPTGEGPTCACRVCRSCSRLAVLNGLRLEYRAVPILERYRVRVDGVLSRYGHVCYDVIERLVPTGEGVTLACRVSRSSSCFVPVNRLCLERCAVPILERYGVRIDCELCRYDEIRLDIGERLVPTGEGVALACRNSRSDCRRVPIDGLGLERRAVPVLEGDGVLVDTEQCRYSHVCFDMIEGLVPTGEGVALTCRNNRSRSRRVPVNGLRLERRTVPVLEGDGVLVDGVLCRYNDVTLNISIVSVPTGEGVTLACRISRRRSTLMPYYSLALQYRAVPILEGDSEGLDRILCGYYQVAGDVREVNVPTGEVVTLTCRVSRSGSSRTVVNRSAQKYRTVPILEGDGVRTRCRGIKRRVGHVAGQDGRRFRIPTCEGIDHIYRHVLTACLCYSGCQQGCYWRTVRENLRRTPVACDHGDVVHIDRVLCLDGQVTRDVAEVGVPTGEGITNACRVCRSDSCLTLQGRNNSNHCIVIIHEGDIVLTR